MALPSINRLPLRGQRERIDREGTPFHSLYFTVVKAPSPSDTSSPRFAVLVSKKISTLAVSRNRLKRQILSSVQSLIPQAPLADYLIIPKPSVSGKKFDLLHNDLKKLIL